MNTHDIDFYTWTQQQVTLLQHRQWGELDLDNLIDEIGSMGRSEKRELDSRLAVLLAHLLKWQYEPARQGKSWRLTIKEQRIKIKKCLRDNPGLKLQVSDIMMDAYDEGLIIAMRETEMDESIFPTICPWSFERIIADDFWP